MPTYTDPADWLISLFETKWPLAVEGLRTDGINLINTTRPQFKPVGRRDATGSILNSVQVKVYQVTPEETNRVTHGDKDEDTTVQWAVKIASGGEYTKARKQIHEMTLIVHRVLLMYRSNPHPDWHRIDEVRIVHDTDYPDFQQKTVTFFLKRYGQATPAAIQQVTT